MGKRYQNEEWLRENYYEKGRSMVDMAQECGVSDWTIGNWMDKFGMERRSQQEAQKPDKAYTDKEWLYTEYVENGRSMSDIGDECEVSSAVILKWLRRFDIETRSDTHHLRYSPPSLTFRPEGYVQISSNHNGKIDRVYEHQLVAILHGEDPYKVFSNGEWHVHHDNGFRYDNRPENLEFKKGEDHIREHSEERVRTPTGEWE